MVSTSWLEDEVRSVLPNCSVEAIDLHGTGDHFHIRIIEDTFEGMRPLQRQKIILNHFKPHIPSPIHAIDLKCMTPQQAESSGDTAFDPHGGGQGIHIKRIRKHQNKE
jgi:acid stress-induced BolA-like protein IbaG/YrbA